MVAGDTAIAISGNLVDDPQLRFTAVLGGFVNSEGLPGLN